MPDLTPIDEAASADACPPVQTGSAPEPSPPTPVLVRSVAAVRARQVGLARALREVEVPA